MKKTEAFNNDKQLKLNFPSNSGAFTKSSYSTGKIVNINTYARKAFASYIVKNSKSF